MNKNKFLMIDMQHQYRQLNLFYYVLDETDSKYELLHEEVYPFQTLVELNDIIILTVKRLLEQHGYNIICTAQETFFYYLITLFETSIDESLLVIKDSED